MGSVCPIVTYSSAFKPPFLPLPTEQVGVCVWVGGWAYLEGIGIPTNGPTVPHIRSPLLEPGVARGVDDSGIVDLGREGLMDAVVHACFGVGG